MLWLANPTCAYQSSYFVNHLYDYRPSWTILSAITIINKYAMLFAIFFRLYCCYFLFSQFFKRSLNPHTGYTIFLMEIFFCVSYYKKKQQQQKNKILHNNPMSILLHVVVTEIKSKVLKILTVTLLPWNSWFLPIQHLYS